MASPSSAASVASTHDRHAASLPPPRLARHTANLTAYLWYTAAAFAEIAGCFAFWAWLRLHKSSLWLLPGIASLCLFALLLTRIDTSHAGRAYAAYGGVYILASLLWLWIVESSQPDRWDLLGAAISLTGAAIILWAPRS